MTISSEPLVNYTQVANLYQSHSKIDKRLLIKEPISKLLDSAYMRRLKFDHDWRVKNRKRHSSPASPEKSKHRVYSVPKDGTNDTPENYYTLGQKKRSLVVTPVKRRQKETYPCYLTTSPHSRVAPSDNYMYEVDKFRLVNQNKG